MMTYLLAQLWLYLLIAGLIGSVIGWLLRGGCKRYSKAVEEMQTKYFALEKKNNLYKKKNEEFSNLSSQKSSLVAEVKRLNGVKQQNKKLSVQLVKMRHGFKKSREIYAQTNQKLSKAQELLTFARQSNQAKDVHIKQVKKEAIVADNLLLKYEAEWAQKYQALNAQYKTGLQKTKESVREKLFAAEALLAEKDSVDSENGVLSEVQSKLTEAEARLADKGRVADELSVQVNVLEEEKNSTLNQLGLFKEQSQEYIAKIAKENTLYKAGVKLLEEDVQQWREQDEKRESELEQTTLSLHAKEKEIVDLKAQLDRKPKQTQEPINRLPYGLVVPKMNLLSRAINAPSSHLQTEAMIQVHNVDVIYGVGKAYAERLGEQGVLTTEDLLLYVQEQRIPENSIQDGNETGIATSKEKVEEKLATIINVDAPEIKAWVVMADLLRLEGVNNEFAKSMQLSGIHSVEDLANREVSKVSLKMTETMQNARRIKNVPEEEEISAWITQSRMMKHINVAEDDQQETMKPANLHIDNLSKPTSWRRVKKFVNMHRRR